MKKFSTWVLLTLSCLVLNAQSIPAGLTGKWLGSLQVGTEVRIVFNITVSGDSISSTLDIPDQGVTGIATSATSFENGQIKINLDMIPAQYVGTYQADSNNITGVWIQGSALPLKLEKTDQVTRKLKPQDPIEPYPYKQEEVTFNHGNISLSGTLTIPEGKGPFKAVILVTGSGPQDRDESLLGHRPFLVLSDYLTRQGIIVLRYDDRGTGKSTGDFQSATTEDFTQDALAAVAYLRSRKDLKIDAIGIAGHSEGGMVAPMAASKNKHVDFIVMMAGPGIPCDSLLMLQGNLITKASGLPDTAIYYSDLMRKNMIDITKEIPNNEARREALLNYYANFMLTTPIEVQEILGVTHANGKATAEAFCTNWMHYFLLYQPEPVLRKLKIPVLAVNGTTDLQVPAKENLAGIERILKSAGNKHSSIEAFENLNHLFQTSVSGNPAEYSTNPESFNEAAMQVIATWILEQ